MTERQQKLLQYIISEYIKTAQPVGSEYVANKLNVSSATIRNEMAILTNDGYLFQPYTSAGRSPTVQGFEYYVDHLLKERTPTKKEKQALDAHRFKSGFNKESKEEQEVVMKYIAKAVAQISGELIILVYPNDNFYYTGLSYLFSQPEFEKQQVVYNISHIVDHLDRSMAEVFKSIGDETEILIGKKNPFSELCGAIFTRCQLPFGLAQSRFVSDKTDRVTQSEPPLKAMASQSEDYHSIMGLLGPVRMDYNKNFGLINYVKEILMSDI